MSILNVKKIGYSTGHVLACLTMLCFFLFPFIAYWDFHIGATEFYLRQGKGFLAVNAIISVALCSLGAAVGGFWWKLCHYLSPENRKMPRLCLLFLFCLVSSYIIHYLSVSHYQSEYILKSPYFIGALVFLLLPLTFQLKTVCPLLKISLTLKKFTHWFKKPNKINTVFYLSLLLALVLNNMFDALRADFSIAETGIFLLGRMGLYLGLCTLLALIIEFLERAIAPKLHWALWSVYASLLIVVTLDAFTSNLGRPLFSYLNDFTALGELNWRQELRGGGFPALSEISTFYVICICASFFLFCFLIAFLCEKLSRKIPWKFSLLQLLLISIFSGLLSAAEQGFGIYWKDLEHRKTEQQIVGIHLGLFAPDKGLGEYAITFTQQPQVPVEKTTLKNAPNVYFIIIESIRADCITPEITPFLYQFQNTECQSIEHTWAGSNATHLSWFSIFHSSPCMHWGRVLEQQREGEREMGAPSIAWLHQNGYNVHLKAAFDSSYKDLGVMNFGNPREITYAIDDSGPNGTFCKAYGAPEKEIALFKKTKSEVLRFPDSQQFHVLGLDSPHYNYYWHSSFTPPFEDYLENIQLPIAPSKEDILKFQKRYWNACAWVDHQIHEFVTFLKQENKFDDAIIVITGDHGEEFREHGNWFHCTNLSPEQTKVPIIIKWPNSVDAPAKSQASHLDIMPSILNYLGASKEALQHYQGKDLLQAGDDHTTITSTNYPGATGHTMKLSRGNKTALFSWDKYWVSDLPQSLVLRSILEDNVAVPIQASSRKVSAEKSLQLLHEYFPDAFERFFSHLEPQE